MKVDAPRCVVGFYLTLAAVAEMTDPTSTDEAKTHTGLNAPLFNGSADEFEDWTQQVELWRHSSSQKPEKLGARLVQQQPLSDFSPSS